jgi:hypothetical protein
MHSIHPAKVGLCICIEDPQAGGAPSSAEVNPEASVVCQRVADPLGAGAILDDDDDAAAVVQIPYGDAPPLTRRRPTVSTMSAFPRVYGGRGIPAGRARLVTAFAIRTTRFGSRI